MDLWIYDSEVYRNYYLVVFVNHATNEMVWYCKFNDQQVSPAATIPPPGTLVGFNNVNYDGPILAAAMTGASNAELKFLSDEIIVGGKKHWHHRERLDQDQIDIMEVLPGKASLKIYGGRNESRRLQDLPVDPASTIDDTTAAELFDYCYNSDCVVTRELFDAMSEEIDLRRTMSTYYGVDLRSKSDAQIAEAVICKEFERMTGSNVERPPGWRYPAGMHMRYTPPKWLKFRTNMLGQLLTSICNSPFVISPKRKILLPDAVKRAKPKLCDVTYKMGVGGLHSVDAPGLFTAEDGFRMFDIDVESFYPRSILNEGYEPDQMRGYFLPILDYIVKTRLNAKHQGDKKVAGSLKIVVNGSFGKFGSHYSRLFSPDLLFHTTMTGQLALLMLIERFPELVLSANTDGVTVVVHESVLEKLQVAVSEWETETGYKMEWTEYSIYARRDVNNYFALDAESGDVKCKGIFAGKSFRVNPTMQVIPNAVIANIVDGIPIDLYIKGNSKVVDFTSLRTVRGGAMKDGVKYGKSIRWYWSTASRSAVHYDGTTKAGDLVPQTERSQMMMNLTDRVPADLDYARYIAAATDLIEVIKNG